MQKPFEITYDMLASRSSRFVNFIIDSIVATILSLSVFAGLNWLYISTGIEGFNIGSMEMGTSTRWSLLVMCIKIVYYGLFETLNARTLGKYVTNSIVVNRDGSTPDTNHILIRTLCRQIPFQEFSFFGVFPIGWHDTFSKTLVVDAGKFKKAQTLANMKPMDNNEIT